MEVVRRPFGGLTRSKVAAAALQEQAPEPTCDGVNNLPRINRGVRVSRVPIGSLSALRSILLGEAGTRTCWSRTTGRSRSRLRRHDATCASLLRFRTARNDVADAQSDRRGSTAVARDRYVRVDEQPVFTLHADDHDRPASGIRVGTRAAGARDDGGQARADVRAPSRPGAEQTQEDFGIGSERGATADSQVQALPEGESVPRARLSCTPPHAIPGSAVAAARTPSRTCAPAGDARQTNRTIDNPRFMEPALPAPAQFAIGANCSTSVMEVSYRKVSRIAGLPSDLPARLERATSRFVAGTRSVSLASLCRVVPDAAGPCGAARISWRFLTFALCRTLPASAPLCCTQRAKEWPRPEGGSQLR